MIHLSEASWVLKCFQLQLESQALIQTIGLEAANHERRHHQQRQVTESQSGA